MNHERCLFARDEFSCITPRKASSRYCHGKKLLVKNFGELQTVAELPGAYA